METDFFHAVYHHPLLRADDYKHGVPGKEMALRRFIEPDRTAEVIPAFQFPDS
jgi:hypothetical protein